MNNQSEHARQPLITIITATYNADKFLENAIESVLGQSYPHIEYIIIDGGSTDNTVNIIKKYQHRLHYWISEKDKGVYDAWNKGVARANGDWIGFIGADDFLLDDHIIENSIDSLNLAISNHIRYVYGKVHLLNQTGNKLITVWGEPWEKCEKNIFQYMTVTHCSAFHHKSLFEEYGNFNESFKVTGDYEFLLREFTKNKKALFINKALAGMRIGGISANVRLKLTVARENIKALTLNDLPVSWRQKKQVYKAHIINLVIKLGGHRILKSLLNFYQKIK